MDIGSTLTATLKLDTTQFDAELARIQRAVDDMVATITAHQRSDLTVPVLPVLAAAVAMSVSTGTVAVSRRAFLMPWSHGARR